MKVLFIQYEANMWGTSKSLLTLIDGLRAEGHAAAVCLAQTGGLQDELRRRDVPVEVVPQYPWLSRARIPVWRRAASCVKHALVTPSRRGLDFCRQFAPDIIHTNTIKTTLGAWLTRRTRVPHVWHVRSYPSGQHSLNMDLTWGSQLSQRYMWSHSDHRVFISDSLRRHFRQAIGDPQSSVIYNGVCSAANMATTEHKPGSQDFRLLYVGRIDEFKDPFIAVRAVGVLKRRGLHVSLQIVGTGPEALMAKLTSCITEEDVADQVECTGYLSEPLQAMRESDALVMPSRHDAFGRVIAEAMASGTVPIAANSPVNYELICHGVDGLIFSPYTPEALARQIEDLARDRERSRRLAANAIRKARSLFTTERYVDYCLNLYEAVRSKN